MAKSASVMMSSQALGSVSMGLVSNVVETAYLDQ
jgi:hypothetical protein